MTPSGAAQLTLALRLAVIVLAVALVAWLWNQPHKPGAVERRCGGAYYWSARKLQLRMAYAHGGCPTYEQARRLHGPWPLP
jgi:hypothetical protein